jgi:hypothetical protein
MNKLNKKTPGSQQKEIHFIHSLKKMLHSCKKKHISLGQVMRGLKDEGLIFLIAVISFPTAIPVPTPPGFTTLFGVPLCILTWQMLYRLDTPWLPKWLANKTVKVSNFESMIEKAEPTFNKLTVFLKPRYKNFTTKNMEKFVGLLALICSISLALPILFGNALPSAGIFIMSMGLLYNDGLTVIIGMVVSVIGIIVATAVVGAFMVMVWKYGVKFMMCKYLGIWC